MKQLLQFILLLSSLSLWSQNYKFALFSDYNGNGDPYEFTFVITPDFDNASPQFADMQLTLAISTGNSIQDNSFTKILGSGNGGVSWNINTNATGPQLQTLGIGDGSLDLWVFTLPSPTAALTTVHSSGVDIPVFTFVVDNAPTTGEISILENSDAIAMTLSGFGLVVDNLINVDLNDGNDIQNYYGGTDPNNRDFQFSSTLSIDEAEPLALDLRLFPNPVSGEFLSLLGDTGVIDHIDIYSLNGQLVATVEKDFDKISVGNLEASVYILQIYGTERSRSKVLRFIKE